MTWPPSRVIFVVVAIPIGTFHCPIPLVFEDPFATAASLEILDLGSPCMLEQSSPSANKSEAVLFILDSFGCKQFVVCECFFGMNTQNFKVVLQAHVFISSFSEENLRCR